MRTAKPSRLRLLREQVLAELLQKEAAAGVNIGNPEALERIEKESWAEARRRLYGDQRLPKRMAPFQWTWSNPEDEPIPEPDYEDPHPLRPPWPLKLKSGFDPERYYRAACKRRGWEGRRPRPWERPEFKHCARCGLQFQLRHVRPEDRNRGWCFRCLARERGHMPPLEPGRVPSRLDGLALRHYGAGRADRCPNEKKRAQALAVEVANALGLDSQR